MSDLHRFIRPELIGRFDEKIVFKPLSHDNQREIGCLAISQELERFKELRLQSHCLRSSL
jgi:ATP-dependent Clp protease ATP-binding subunit ClpA